MARGQAITEFLLIAVFLIVLAGYFMLQTGVESEISIAVAGARLGCLEYNTIVNSSEFCTTIVYEENGDNLTIRPHLYNTQGQRVTAPAPVFTAYVLSGVAGSILNNRSYYCDNCMNCEIGHFNYCINTSA